MFLLKIPEADDPAADAEESPADGVAPAVDRASRGSVCAALSGSERDAGYGLRSGRAEAFVMLLDNSYSMRYGQNFDKMKTEALSADQCAGRQRSDGDRGFQRQRDRFGEPATDDKGKLRAAVDALEPSSLGTRYFDAFSVADRLLSQFGGAGTEPDHHFRLSAHGLEPVESGERDRTRRESGDGLCWCRRIPPMSGSTMSVSTRRLSCGPMRAALSRGFTTTAGTRKSRFRWPCLINDKEEARKTVIVPRVRNGAGRVHRIRSARWGLRRAKSRSWRTIRCRRTTSSFSHRTARETQRSDPGCGPARSRASI